LDFDGYAAAFVPDESFQIELFRRCVNKRAKTYTLYDAANLQAKPFSNLFFVRFGCHNRHYKMIFSFSNFLIKIFRLYAPKEKVGNE